VNATDTVMYGSVAELQAKNEGNSWSALMYSTIGGVSDPGP
jgi:hypothetical protein